MDLLWVVEYRTGSGSDRVERAIKITSPFHDLLRILASNDEELRGSQTQSLPLPVLYSSTHDKSVLNLAMPEEFCAKAVQALSVQSPIQFFQ
jgi:hypothetical protein